MTSPRTRGLALALAGTVAALAIAGCGDDEPTSVSDDPTPSKETSSAPAPTEEATSSDASPTESAPAETATVPLYFVGDSPPGPRLFREFRKVPADNPLDEALALLTAGDTLDPDYRSDFPDGNFGAATYDESIVIPLPDASWTTRPDGMTRKQAKLAVQQVVYTAQGVLQERAPLVFTLEGDSSPIFGIDTTRGVKAARQLDVLGLVNVTSPEQGSTVNDTFTAVGLASSFEATVPWQIRQGGPDGAVVLDGFSTAEGWIDRLYPWEADVDVSRLEPGDYSFVAMTDDPSGGEGFGPTEDSKTITIE